MGGLGSGSRGVVGGGLFELVFCFVADDIPMSYDFYESGLVRYHEIDCLIRLPSSCLIFQFICGVW
jgi:hypothetical protein